MIGFHIQNSPENWPEADSKLPDNAVIKFLFGVERASEAKTKSWYRWVGSQPLVTGSGLEQHCRNWLNQFVDGTFKREARHIHFTQEYNETFANSQSETEREAWKELHKTMARLWATEYRTQPELAHIRLILAETAIGNDIPLGVARAAQEYDAIVGYHPYIVCRNKQVSPTDWRWYSGRWETMDEFYLANGVSVDWAFGEMGAVLDASANWSGWLDPQGGWKHPDCLNGDINTYLNVLKYWLDNATKTKAYRQGRIAGGVLFTSGAPGSGPDWQHFDIKQPDMNTIADFVAGYPYPPIGTPPPTTVTQPRTPYSRTMHVLPQDAPLQTFLDVAKLAYDKRQTIGFSYDDGGYGAPSAGVEIEPLKSTQVVLYDILDGQRESFIEWYDRHYKGTAVSFAASAANREIIDIVDELPVHPEKEYDKRPVNAINTLTIHHAASNTTPEQMANYHVNSHDWPGIGYGFVIMADGTIYQTNHLDTKSYHAGSYDVPGDENYWSLGICLSGNFTDSPPPAAQLDATKYLVQRLKNTLSTITDVTPHRGMPGASTQCPGNTYLDWFPYVAGA